MKEINNYFTKSFWHVSILFTLVYCLVYMLSLIFMPAYTNGFVGGLLVFQLVAYIIYKRIVLPRKGVAANNGHKNLMQLIAGDKWLGILLVAALGTLLAVLLALLVQSLNIFISMPVAAALGGLAGYGLHRALLKKYAS